MSIHFLPGAVSETAKSPRVVSQRSRLLQGVVNRITGLYSKTHRGSEVPEDTNVPNQPQAATVDADPSIVSQDSLLSPAQQTPFEILSYIFILSLESQYHPSDYFDWSNPRFPPNVFSRVNSLWRSAALGTPQLWASVSIDVVPGNKWWYLFNLFILRSGNLPLSLDLSWRPPKAYDSFSKNVHRAMYEVLIPMSSRWKRLRLVVPDIILTEMLSRPLPLLEDLMLSGRYTYFPSLQVPGRAPSLRSVSFTYSALEPMLWNMPWNQLTEVNCFESLTGSHILWLLGQCPRLEKCHLCVGHCTPLNKVLVLPDLKNLTFEWHYKSPAPFRYLLDNLILPSLKHLNFTVDAWLIFADSAFFLPSIGRWGCSLESFVLIDFVVSKDGLRDMVRCIPSLNRLVCWYDGKDNVPDDIKEELGQRGTVKN